MTAHGDRPERLAAAARLLQQELLEALALASDAIADDLAERLGMVAWEREEQIGLAQRRLQQLREQRFDHHGGEPVLVRELRAQPLEALELAWRELRCGRRVHVESEAGACPGVHRILRDMAELLGGAGLTVTAPGILDHPQASWRRVGVEPRCERVALVQDDADHELAAYLLARACLRRTGFDPRVIHRVITIGPAPRLERTLRRLWMGARMGPVDDEQAFAGPVTDDRVAAYLHALAHWSELEGVQTLCAGSTLQRSDAPGQRFLAPSLFRAAPEGPAMDPASAPVGPMLIVHPVTDGAQAEALLESLTPAGHGRVRFGSKPRALELRPEDRQIHGALLVERLPPGLPEPRP